MSTRQRRIAIPPIPSAKLWASVLGRLTVEADSHCWLWIGGTGTRQRGGKDGRARCLDLDGSPLVSPHRLLLTWAKGPAPSDEHVACHRCGHPLCCNPTHLYWGWQSDNERDKRYGSRLGDPADLLEGKE